MSSYEKIEENQMGLLRNSFTGKVDTTTVYESGLHMVGLTGEFILFPKTIETILYKNGEGSDSGHLTITSFDGIDISLEISFDYKLIPSQIGDLYTNYTENYEARYVQKGRSVLRDVASTFKSTEFIQNRTMIGNVMADNLSEAFTTFYAHVFNFNLRDIQLPENIVAGWESIQLEILKQQEELEANQTAIIKGQTEKYLTELAAELAIIEAENDAEVLLINIQAQTEAVNITLTIEADALAELAATMGFNSTEMLDYLWIQAISELDDGVVIIGENTSQIILDAM